MWSSSSDLYRHQIYLYLQPAHQEQFGLQYTLTWESNKRPSYNKTLAEPQILIQLSEIDYFDN